MKHSAADLSLLYADADALTLNGAAGRGFPEFGYAEALGAAGVAHAMRCIASEVSGAAVGQSLVHESVTYTVRGIEPIAPDALETRLFLERA